MKRLLSTLFPLFLLLMLPLLGAAQDQGASEDSEDESVTWNGIEEGALREAKHFVSEKTAVHTYRVKKVSPKEVDDADGEGKVPDNVAPLLSTLRETEGGQRAGFDAATATITVVSSHEAELPQHLLAKR